MDTPREDAEDADAMLADWVTGGRSDSDPELCALLARRPELGDRLPQLRALAGELGRVGGVDPDWLRAAAARPSPFDDAVRRRVVTGLATARSRRRWPLALAAAAVVIVGAVLAWSRRPQATADSTLGNGVPPAGVDAASPSGPVERVDRFRWRLPLPSGCTYVLRVQRLDGEVVFEVPGLTESSWQPDRDHLRQLVGRLTWIAEVIDVEGQWVDGTDRIEFDVRR